MKYKYRNVKTGEIITTSNRVGGKNWEQVEDTTIQNSNDDLSRDDTSQDDTFEDITPDEDPVAEEIPAEKPKPTRRGKK